MKTHQLIFAVLLTWMGMTVASGASASEREPQANRIQEEAAPYFLAISASRADVKVLNRSSWVASWQKSDEWIPPAPNLKVLDYSTPIRTRQGELTLNLEAPGAGRAILSLALEF